MCFEQSTDAIKGLHEYAAYNQVQKLAENILRSKRGNVSDMDALVPYESTLDSKAFSKQTPLMRAFEGDAVFTGEWLFDNGADICKKSEAVGQGEPPNETIFHFAAIGNSTKVLRLLAHFRNYCPNSKVPLVDEPNSDGNTALHLSAEEGHFTITEIFVKHFEADAFIKRKDGITAFHRIAQRGWLKVVKYLAKKNQRINIKGDTGDTAVDRVQKYCWKGADCSSVIEYLRTFQN